MSEQDPTLSLDDARALGRKVLISAGASAENADSVARALAMAEEDGIASHGLARLPFYADQIGTGKVNGTVTPEVKRDKPAAVHVDARDGFAFPAIDAGIAAALDAARAQGSVAVAIGNSHHAGVLGHLPERLAEHGLVAFAVTNSPEAIAPWGGNKPLFGTNPIAFACPRASGPSLVVDLSLSKVARGKIMMAAKQATPIPEGWALDKEGMPTTDPEAALEGSMVPMGDAKGSALVLMVELLAAALTGSHFGYEASSFFDADGPAPRVGQFFFAMDPGPLAGGGFLDRAETLLAAIEAQSGARLPGARRLRNRERARAEGITLTAALFDDLSARAG